MTSESEILALFDQWNQALQGGDVDRIVALYAPNAILIPTLSNEVRHDHARIREYFADHFVPKQPSGVIDESHVRWYGDVAINSGLYTFTLGNPGDGEPVVPARYTFVYQWSGDRWFIVEHHSSARPEKVTASPQPASRSTLAKAPKRARTKRQAD